MELPKYHAPTLRNTFGAAWTRLRFFIRRAGVAITIVVLLLSIFNSLGTDGTFGNEDSEESVLSAVGKGITPVFQPMGIEQNNWPATVGLFTGLFAKEVIVGSLNSLYAVEASSPRDAAGGVVGATGAQFDPWETESAGTGAADPGAAEAQAVETASFSVADGVVEAFGALGEGLTGIFTGIGATLGFDLVGYDARTTASIMQTDRTVFTGMRSYFTPFSAYAYLLFVLIYFPCVAAFGTAIQEMGWKYGVLQAAYLTVLAWCTATLFYQVAVGHSLLFIILPLAVLAGIFFLLGYLGRGGKLERA
jgi:ferrous iron transport protein B